MIYKMSLTTVPISVVTVLFTVQGECTLSTLKLNLASKAEQSITVQAPDNFVDEGTNTISYTCNISHTLSSTDTNYNSKVYMTQVSVVDDDVADVKVAAYCQSPIHFWQVSMSCTTVLGRGKEYDLRYCLGESAA